LAPVPLAAGRCLLTHPRVEPLVSTALLARLVANPARFALAELAGRGRVVVHRVRRGGAIVVLQHGTPDVQSFDELFYQQIYAPPPEVDAALAALDRAPRILDVGANIGLFGAWALARWPEAEIEAFEPDPRNAALHRRTIAASGRGAVWRLHEAAAAAADGEMRFVTGRYAMSGPATDADRAAATVPARDVLPLMARADVVKIDAEGSEWAILDDPRLAATAARALALEYHPELCPEDDARTAAVRRLHAAGFAVRDVPTQAPPGYGSLWAWREVAAPGR
jgi:FkbM family methyltransferase